MQALPGRVSQALKDLRNSQSLGWKVGQHGKRPEIEHGCVWQSRELGTPRKEQVSGSRMLTAMAALWPSPTFVEASLTFFYVQNVSMRR